MKLITAALATTMTAYASGLMAPDLFSDGRNLDPSAPGIGALIVAIPGSTWLWGWNEGTDYDFNDAYGTATFGYQAGPFVQMTLSYASELTADTDHVRLGFAGIWLAAGDTATYTVLAWLATVESMKDTTTGITTYSGPGIGNPGGAAAMWTQMQTPECPVPEPATALLIGAALVMIGARRWL